MTQVCDFSNQSIDLNAVAKHFSGIISYTSDYTPKNLTKANFDKALSLKLSVVTVCEQGNQPALRGAAGGTHDAQISNGQDNVLGYDPTATQYYVAEDPSQVSASSWPTVVSYFQAVNAQGGRPVGGYGGWATLNHLHGLGLISKGWMVETWNKGAPDPLPSWVVLMQMVGVDTLGLPIDVDNVLQSDYGQMPRPAQPKPPPTGVKDMATSPVFAFKPNQVDLVQVSPANGVLYHKWSIDGGNAWASEPVASGPFQGTPQIEFVLGSHCRVAVEGSTYPNLVTVYKQTVSTGTATDTSWQKILLP